jgi:hypothetical protein
MAHMWNAVGNVRRAGQMTAMRQVRNMDMTADV